MFKQTLKLFLVTGIFSMTLFLGCGDNTDEIGIGPIKSEIKLAAVEISLALKGKGIFEVKCMSCHKFDQKLVGPPLQGVTKRRKPEWIMNMMLNPLQMTQENPTAKELFATYLIQMTFQDISQDDSRAILEYFRSVDDNVSLN